MADDSLKVDLEISDDLASAKLSNFNRVLDATERKINDTGKSSTFAKNFGVQFDEIERKAEKTRKALAEVTSQRIVGGNFDGVTQSLIRAQNESTKLRARLSEIKSAIETTPSSKTSLLKIMADDARAVEIELAKIERFQQRLQNRSNSPASTGGNSRGNDFASGAIGATGLPLGYAAAGAAIGYGVGKFSSDIVQAARIAEDSNRVLLATAKETGIAYDQLSAKAKNFGELTGQSTNAASFTFASITQFAQQAGRTNQIDKFTQSLADLAAARGISADKLPDLISQLKTGQDEVFDKLKGAGEWLNKEVDFCNFTDFSVDFSDTARIPLKSFFPYSYCKTRKQFEHLTDNATRRATTAQRGQPLRFPASTLFRTNNTRIRHAQ
jgi:hypothetical protein